MTISLSVVFWLSLVSWFDLRTREIPHIAWVAVPLAVAAIYRAALGDWPLALLAGLVVLASERRRLPGKPPLALWAPALAILAAMAGPELMFGSLAILVFWLAWEMDWWGGADALAVIALILIWPDLPFLAALIAVHGVVCLALGLADLWNHRRLGSHRIAGLPLLLVSAALRGFGVW